MICDYIPIDSKKMLRLLIASRLLEKISPFDFRITFGSSLLAACKQLVSFRQYRPRYSQSSNQAPSPEKVAWAMTFFLPHPPLLIVAKFFLRNIRDHIGCYPTLPTSSCVLNHIVETATLHHCLEESQEYSCRQLHFALQ